MQTHYFIGVQNYFVATKYIQFKNDLPIGFVHTHDFFVVRFVS
jgi:hypothetical protein